MTYAGYILGFPTDTPESIARDIDIIKKELPIELLEFFFLTPLPGSEDHQTLHLRGVPMDPDMNNYDLEHACTAHATMSKQAWEGVYADAWDRYYSDQHVETIMRRAVATGINKTKIFDAVTVFRGAYSVEGVHPLQFGFIRRKIRTQRRPGLPIVNPLMFYPRRAVEMATVAYKWWRLIRRHRAIMNRIVADPAAATYMDEALRPVTSADAGDFVETYADRIPNTYGAPTKQSVAAA